MSNKITTTVEMPEAFLKELIKDIYIQQLGGNFDKILGMDVTFDVKLESVGQASMEHTIPVFKGCKITCTYEIDEVNK